MVAINNLGRQPVDFRVSQVEALQHVGGSDYTIPVVTYELLVQEEKNRQVAMAILTGVAAGANAYSGGGGGFLTAPPNGFNPTASFSAPTLPSQASPTAAAAVGIGISSPNFGGTTSNLFTSGNLPGGSGGVSIGN